jgi:hypothetical protein
MLYLKVWIFYIWKLISTQNSRHSFLKNDEEAEFSRRTSPQKYNDLLQKERLFVWRVSLILPYCLNLKYLITENTNTNKATNTQLFFIIMNSHSLIKNVIKLILMSYLSFYCVRIIAFHIKLLMILAATCEYRSLWS